MTAVPGASARVAALFDRVADTYDAVGVPWFGPIAEGLVSAVAPQPGEAGLDLGCGRGAALLPLAAAVGPSGHVTGVDLAPRMVQLAAEAAAGLDHVDVLVADAADPPLPRGRADVLVSSLVLFFLPSPAQALTTWVGLLRPGGRLGVSTFAERDDAWHAVDDLFTPYLPPVLLDARTSGARGPFASDDAMAQLLADAGLEQVRTSRLAVTVTFADVGAWVTWSRSHGQRAMWDHVPPADQAGLVEQADALLRATRSGAGPATLTQQVRYTVGRRPAP